MGQKYRHLSYEDRHMMAEMLAQGKSRATIATELGYNSSTIYREFDRGDKYGNGHYDPEYSEEQYQAELQKKGRPLGMSISDALAQHISDLILNEGLSPERIISRLRGERSFSEYPQSRNTIYAAIDAGIIPNVTRQSLRPDTTTMFSNGLVQLPKWMREKLALSDGDTLQYGITDDGILIRKAPPQTLSNGMTDEAEFIFRIRDYLAARGLKYESAIDEGIKARQNGKQYSFSEHTKGLIYSLLTNQTPWKRIVPHLREVDAIFFNYDIDAIKGTPTVYFETELRRIRCGNRNTRAQMNALHGNIEVFERIAKKYGSLDAFVISSPAHEVVSILSSNGSEYKLTQVGEALAWEYLRNVGIDGAKPDLHLRRFFGCDRMGYSEKESASVSEVLAAVDSLSEITGLTKATIDNLIWSFCADGYGEICTSSPRCFECVIKDFCKGGGRE